MTTALMEKASSLREAEQRSEQDDRAQLLAHYTAILRRQDEPLEADAENLLTVVGDLRLSQGQVQADAALVARYMRLSASAVEYEALHAIEVELRENFRRVRKESERAVQVADAEQAKASTRASMSCLAQSEVVVLRRNRPDLFPDETPTS